MNTKTTKASEDVKKVPATMKDQANKDTGEVEPGAVALRRNTEMTAAPAIDLEGDSGAGMEGTDKDSFAIPFLQVLQGLSPQLETVEGAKPGLIINTLTNELFKSVRFIPCAFQRRYNKWLPRSQGGGFKGTMLVSEYEQAIAAGVASEVVEIVEGKPRTKVMLNADNGGTELKDTRSHFVLYENAEGAWSPALISLASSQIKKSKRLMALVQNYVKKGTNGRSFTPPSFARVYEGTVVEDSNELGKWKSFEFAGKEDVTDPELYRTAKTFYELVTSGKVVAAPPPEDIPQDGEAGGGEGGKF